MKVLLDTHAFLWAISDSARLSPRGRSIFLDDDNQLLLSAASVWEIAIKLALGRLTTTDPLGDLLDREMKANSIRLMPIEIEHCLGLTDLPFHHRDPFDRMLVVQAMCEDCRLLSTDRVLDKYGVQRIW